MKAIPYGRQQVTEEDINRVSKVLQSDFLTQGEKVREFEEEFARYVGSKYAVAVANGTAALHLCTLALGVNEKSRVITSPISFVATANCVRYCGGTVYFSDIDPDTYLIDLNKLEELLSGKEKGFFEGIIPVDFSGRPVNAPLLRELADEYGCWVIEDACHAPGGFGNYNKTNWRCGDGQFADLSIFSFHPVKHIACGEGGMITTNNKNLYDKLLMSRSHGITRNPQKMDRISEGNWYYEMQELGFNYRLSDINCSLGLSQLERAKEGLERRIKIAKTYDIAFSKNEKILNHSGVHAGHAYHLYIIEVEQRGELYNYLRENKVFAQIHYIPIHLQPYYQQLGWKEGDFPNAEKYYSRCISLPMFPSLTNEEVEYVIDLVEHFLKNEI